MNPPPSGVRINLMWMLGTCKVDESFNFECLVYTPSSHCQWYTIVICVVLESTSLAVAPEERFVFLGNCFPSLFMLVNSINTIQQQLIIPLLLLNVNNYYNHFIVMIIVLLFYCSQPCTNRIFFLLFILVWLMAIKNKQFSFIYFSAACIFVMFLNDSHDILISIDDFQKCTYEYYFELHQKQIGLDFF